MTRLPIICPVCGWSKLDEPPYGDYTGGIPSYESCACCGFQFGFHDSNSKYTFVRYRDEWINRGFPFNYKPEKPHNWNREMMLEQLKNVEGLNYKPRI